MSKFVTNKALASEQKKIAESDVLDGVSIFAPKIITKKQIAEL